MTTCPLADSSALVVGETVFALGSPLGPVLEVSQVPVTLPLPR